MNFLMLSLTVTPVRRLHPKLGNLIRFRRMLGLYAFFYATLHLATYVFLFSGYDVPGAVGGLRAGRLGALVDAWKAVWPTMLDDVKKRRFIQVGLVAWLILVPLAVTSPTFMLRWLGGWRWQTLHRMVYVAAALAIIHYWWLVKPGVLSPLPMTVGLVVLLGARLAWALVERRKRQAVSIPA